MKSNTNGMEQTANIYENDRTKYLINDAILYLESAFYNELHYKRNELNPRTKNDKNLTAARHQLYNCIDNLRNVMMEEQYDDIYPNLVRWIGQLYVSMTIDDYQQHCDEFMCGIKEIRKVVDEYPYKNKTN